jgi:hypothetical protein
MSATAVATCVETLHRAGLLTDAEVRAISGLLDPASMFAPAVDAAETLHLHVKVDDTARLPEGEFLDAGASLDHRREGYVKFRFPEGINAIFSHIRIAQEEAPSGDAARRARPYLDHVGIDLRTETDAVRAVFESAPAIAARFAWGHAAQGGDRPVFCCHTSVRSKHWVYPTCGPLAGIPVELAYGALTVHGDKSGCDLRPAAPGTAAAACCPDDPSASCG